MNFFKYAFYLISISFVLVNFTTGLKKVANFHYHNSTIFHGPYCRLMCILVRHTLCDPFPFEGYSKRCENFTLHSTLSGKFKPLRVGLLEGHNGIRDRVAYLMKIPNMLELTWDWELSRMADAYMKLCHPFADDRCAAMQQEFRPYEQFSQFYYTESNAYKLIKMNRAFIYEKYLPVSIVSDAILIWYSERNYMNRPHKTTIKKLEFSRLVGDNNFTHMIYPLAYRFGCSFASMFNGISIVCYYFPYYESPEDYLYFLTGEPSSQCPSTFPLKSQKYTNLCSQSYVMDKSQRNKCESFLIIILIFILIIY